MGCPLSKGTGRAPPVLEIDGTTGTTSGTNPANEKMQYGAELSSYAAACQVDPEIRSFDVALQQRTTHVISALAVGIDIHSLSFNSLREVTGGLLDMNQEVVKLILESKKDIWKNPELFGLVEEYFESSLQTLDFCTVLEKCLNKARGSQMIVQVALQRFLEEKDVEDAGNGKYERTLVELRSFKKAGDPFTEEFFQVFQSVYKKQLLMLEKLQLRKNKLDRKSNSHKAWRKVSSIIFASTFAAILICSVVAAAMTAPPVVVALAAAASVAMGSVGKWIDSLWKGYMDALKGQKVIINTMQVGTYVAIKDLESIRALIEQLEIQVDSLLHNADFALEGKEAVKLGVEEITKKLTVFLKSIEDLGQQADQCSRNIRKARTIVLQRIMKHPD